jgi:hypothetical protein
MKWFVLQFITTDYIWLTLHTAVEWQNADSLLSMPAFTNRNKEMDFPALKCMCSHFQMLLQLPLHFVFTYANEKGRIPQEFVQSKMITLPKKGNATECSNYRTISLVSHASKVLLNIIKED